jgi:hypothetical protein
VLRRVIDIVGERHGACRPVLLEDLDAHTLANERGGDMVGGTAHDAVAQARPSLQCLAPRNEFRVAARHLPGATCPSHSTRGDKCHQFQIFGARLVVVEACGGGDCIAEGCVRGDVANGLPVEVDGAPVLQPALHCIRVGLRRSLLGLPEEPVRVSPQ